MVWRCILFDSEIRDLHRAPFAPFRQQKIRYTGGPTVTEATTTESIPNTNRVADGMTDTATLVEALVDAGVAVDSVGFQYHQHHNALTDGVRVTDSLSESVIGVIT